MLPAGGRPATSWVHYTTSCNTQSSAPEEGRNNRPKHVQLFGIINKPLLLHLVGYLYYLSQPQINMNVDIYRFIQRRGLGSWTATGSSIENRNQTHSKINGLRFPSIVYNIPHAKVYYVNDVLKHSDMLDFEGNDIPPNCIINSLRQVSLLLVPTTGFHNESPLYWIVLHF